MTTVVDAEGAVLGRLASELAPRALDGEEIAVVNAEEIVVSGDPDEVVEDYRKRDELKSDRGPIDPKRPDGIAKRTLRGMLPYKKPRGQEAMANVMFYIGVPMEYEDEETEQPVDTVEDIAKGGYVTLDEVSRSIGANVTW